MVSDQSAAVPSRRDVEKVSSALHDTPGKTTRAAPSDPRTRCFLTTSNEFTSVIFGPEIYEPDPYDVELIHHEARVAFSELLDPTGIPTMQRPGRILLVRGDAGTGKSHLLRAFRCYTHEEVHGFATYVQLATSEASYERYLLHCIVHSLAKPYARATGERTGLQQLARGLVQLLDAKLQEVASQLMQATSATISEQSTWVERLCDGLQRHSALQNVSPNVLRVLLYALPAKPRAVTSILAFLRCEPMTANDCALLGGLTPAIDGDAAFRMVCQLARIVDVTRQAPLVLMFDQAESSDGDAINEPRRMFTRAFDAVLRIASVERSIVAVFMCLSDLFKVISPKLTKSMLDRFEPAQELRINRTDDEIKALVAGRLSWMFAKAGITTSTKTSVFPIPEPLLLASTTGKRTRDVLDWCDVYQKRCAAAGRILDTDNDTTTGDEAAPPRHPPLKPPLPGAPTLAEQWQRVRKATKPKLDDESELLSLLRETAALYAKERGFDFQSKDGANDSAHIHLSRGDETTELTLAITNKGYHAGAFGLQLNNLRKAARTRTPIAVRTTPFPRGKACDAALEALRAHGGEGYVVEPEVLRTMLALRGFRAELGDDDKLQRWLCETKPLSTTTMLKQIFETTRHTSAGD